MLTRLWSALARVVDGASSVADSLHSLAETFREANAQVRHQLGLPAPVAVEQLSEPATVARRVKPK